jgi:hypothetical protein
MFSPSNGPIYLLAKNALVLIREDPIQSGVDADKALPSVPWWIGGRVRMGITEFFY